MISRPVKSARESSGARWPAITPDSQATPAATVVPLVKETTGPRLAYRIAMGVRYADQEWKRELNRTIRENQPAINKLLLSFGVPLLDDNDRAITEDSIPR